MKKLLASFITATVILTSTISVFAETKNNDLSVNTIKQELGKTNEFVNNESKEIVFDLNCRGIQEKEVTLSNGEKGVLGITPVETNSFSRVSNGKYKIYFYGVSANASFYVNINNNRITRAYDPWHLIVGASVKSSRLAIDSSKQATYYFEFGTPIWDFGGWTGWVRARLNSNNKIVVSIK
ncbi:MAG: DUF5626 family protein [Clostridium sp.]